jgi:hypothetical protein
MLCLEVAGAPTPPAIPERESLVIADRVHVHVEASNLWVYSSKARQARRPRGVAGAVRR